MQSIDPGHQGPTALNGTADVEICAAPASGKRRQVIAIRVTNLDTVQVQPILKRDVSGTKTEIDRIPSIPAVLSGVNITDSSLASRDKPIHLIGTTQSLYMALAAAITTTNPSVEVEFLESTD